MKFNILPTVITEYELFQYKKDKKKQIWIRVTWGWYDWAEFDTNDFDIFKNCKTIEEIKLKLDKAIKNIVPIKKQKKHELHKYFQSSYDDNVFDTLDLSEALGSKDDLFLNESSGGMSRSDGFAYENISKKELEETKKDENEEEWTLSEASNAWQDEVLRQFGYEGVVGVTTYDTPLKVVEVGKDRTKTETLKIIQKDGFELENLPDHFKKDKEIVLLAIKQNGFALQFADNSLKKDKKIVLAAVKESGDALKYADNSLKKDREIVLEAVKQNGSALNYADDSFRKDREIVLEAVKQYGGDLDFADDSLKKDKEFVLEVVKQYGDALKYADDSLKNDPDILAIVNKDK